jgi:predicted DNA-binding antitoxin AbrB/MazE fold protein
MMLDGGVDFMTSVQAIYENGVFRPLEPVKLPEHQIVRVTLQIESAPEAADQLDFALPPERWEQFCAALDAPPSSIQVLRELQTGTPLQHEERDSSQ